MVLGRKGERWKSESCLDGLCLEWIECAEDGVTAYLQKIV